MACGYPYRYPQVCYHAFGRYQMQAEGISRESQGFKGIGALCRMTSDAPVLPGAGLEPARVAPRDFLTNYSFRCCKLKQPAFVVWTLPLPSRDGRWTSAA